MEYRSLLMNNIYYGYEKAAAGSFKDFVPDHYRLGYYMINYGRRKYGERLWAGVMQDAVKYKRIFYPFSRSLKRRTGLTTRKMYKKVRNELDSIWKAQDREIKYLPTKKINRPRKRTVVNYEFPAYLGNTDTLVVQKRGYNEVQSYYKIYPDGTEKRITLGGLNPSLNNSLSVNAGKLCWAESRFHPRWGLKDYSVIKIYDLKEKRRKKITTKSKYFAPALSPDGRKIVVVETSADLKHTLVILDDNGKVLKRLANPNNNYYTFPVWADNDHLVVVRQKIEQNQLQLINTTSEKVTNLTKPTTQLMAYPYAHGDFVFFSAAYTGIHNIFAVKKGEEQLYQVTSSKLGAFYPSVSADGNTLVMSEFSPKGYDITTLPLKPENWIPYNDTAPIDNGFYKIMSEQAGGSIIEKLPNNKFPIKKYNKWTGILNPHSLLFTVMHPNYGVSLLSDNKFSTLSAEISGIYNVNEETFTYGGALRYAELFPVITVGYQRGNRSRLLGTSSIVNDSTITFGINQQRWTEDRFSGGIEIPLNFSGGPNFQNITFNADFQQININFDNEDISILQLDTLRGNGADDFARRNLNFANFEKQNVQALDFRLRIDLQQRRALQHINPRFWFYLDLRYRQTIGQNVNQGNVFLGLFNLYLPGFAKNHSLFFNTAYQSESFYNSYKFTNFFPYSRGYGSWFEDNAFRYGINYTFPLLYPDLPLSSLLFIKRIKANLFYDFTSLRSSLIDRISSVQGPRFMRSAGVELTFDIRTIRLLEVDLGFRWSYMLDANAFGIANPNKFDFLLLRIGI